MSCTYVSSSVSSYSSSDTGRALRKLRIDKLLSESQIKKLEMLYHHLDPTYEICKIKWHKEPKPIWEFVAHSNIFIGSDMFLNLTADTILKLKKKINRHISKERNINEDAARSSNL